MAESKAIRDHLTNAEDREALLQVLFDGAPLPLQICDPEGHSIIVNPALEKMFGRGPPPEYKVTEDQILTRQGLIEDVRRGFAGEALTLAPAWYDPRMLPGVDQTGLTGNRVGIQATITPLRGPDGGVRNVAIWGRDITSELELRGWAERQRLAFAAARLVSWDTSLTKGTMRFSENAREVLGLGAAPALETLDDLLALVHPEDRAAFAAVERNGTDRGGHSDTEFRFQRPSDGVVMWLERRSQVWRDEISDDVWRRGVLMDVSERVARGAALRESEEALRRTEDQLRQAHKLEAIGRLAGGIAHDFNNLLSVILSCGEFLSADATVTGRAQEDVEAIRRAGQQAAQLTRQLLAVSRRQVLEPRVLDLSETVRGTAELLRRVLGENIQLIVRTADRANVLVDAGQMDQVVMNLAINAQDAMPSGGTLTIETQHVMLDAAYARDHLGVSAGPHVMLAVSDTGIGMDRETQSHLFEPFFTKKAQGKGTGLGLATVFGIVQQCRGSIWVYSELGQGTTFKLYFPVASAPGEAAALPPAPVTLTGTETVLVVEDQDEVRHVACDILRRHGYQVLSARLPSEALAICGRHGGDIHLLLTDIVMPEMNGQALAERVVALRPSTRVLLMSGYTAVAIQHHEILNRQFAYLQKPLVPEALARRVREVLSR